MNAQKLVEPRFTYGDYRCWQGDERWELIDGEALLMSPAPRRLHQEISVGLAAQLFAFLRGQRCRVYAAPFDVRLPEADEPDDEVATVVQPDVAVICDRKKLDDAGCRGAPDFIAEILSASTASRDRILKRDLYERHGVREFWLIDPDRRQLTIYLYEPATRRFLAPQIVELAGRQPLAVLPGCAIDWASVFAD